MRVGVRGSVRGRVRGERVIRDIFERERKGDYYIIYYLVMRDSVHV